MGAYQIELLKEVLRAQPELRYGFAADDSGRVLLEVGDSSTLRPDTAVIDVAKRPGSITSWYEECQDYSKTNPDMVPRLYGQGRTLAVIGIPREGLLILVAGRVPGHIAKGEPLAHAHWMEAYRNRVWETVMQVFLTGDQAAGPSEPHRG